MAEQQNICHKPDSLKWCLQVALRPGYDPTESIQRKALNFTVIHRAICFYGANFYSISAARWMP